MKTKPNLTGVSKLPLGKAVKRLGAGRGKLEALVREGALTVLRMSSSANGGNRYFLEDELDIFNKNITRGWEACCEAMRGYRRTWGRV